MSSGEFFTQYTKHLKKTWKKGKKDNRMKEL